MQRARSARDPALRLNILFASPRIPYSTVTLAPDVLISLISEESERQKAQRSRRSGKSKDDEKDEALSVGASSKAKSTGAKRDNKKPRGVCWNCGEKGHFKPQCPKPPKSEKSSDNSAGKKKAGDVHAVLETDSDSDGVHAVFVDTDSETDSMLGLQSVSNTETGSMPRLQSVTRSLCSDSGGAGEAEDDGESCLEDGDVFSEVGSNAGDFDDPDWDPAELLGEINEAAQADTAPGSKYERERAVSFALMLVISCRYVLAQDFPSSAATAQLGVCHGWLVAVRLMGWGEEVGTSWGGDGGPRDGA
ncbi:hypothetical protein D9619_011417 [Psilocybe cf. subviscida]|uniref:CCHC-type domain-containing protein n=1 Tax=Psilocybe cf. subviscida TaxID=2480587 RepID=A0A8H5BIT6_9AGAR|nr:hypothetical protein D9619_011417 [Psilocybe cf. subviscida]